MQRGERAHFIKCREFLVFTTTTKSMRKQGGHKHIAREFIQLFLFFCLVCAYDRNLMKNRGEFVCVYVHTIFGYFSSSRYIYIRKMKKTLKSMRRNAIVHFQRCENLISSIERRRKKCNVKCLFGCEMGIKKLLLTKIFFF